MKTLIREFLRYSYMRKSNKKRKLVLRTWRVMDWDHEIEAAGRFALLLPEQEDTMKITIENFSRAIDLISEAERILFPAIQGECDFDNPLHQCWDAVLSAYLKLRMLQIQEAAS